MEKKCGRPKGAKTKQHDLGKVCHSSRRSHSQASSSQRTHTSPERTTRSKSQPETPTRSSIPATVTPKTNSAKRKHLYLIKHGISQLRLSKLPLNIDILRRSVELRENGLNLSDAVKNVTHEIKSIYSHHFGYSLIYGKDSIQAKGYPNESKKLIVKDQKIWKLVTKMYNDWVALKYEEGRGADRSKNFESKEQIFREMLLDPMAIHKQNPEEILKKSGIKEWKEDLQHLQNQMERTQIGTALGEDRVQKLRDMVRERRKTSSSRLEDRQKKKDKVSASDILLTSSSSDDKQESSSSDNDWGKEPPTKKPKVDVMSSTAATADRLGLSHRQRTMYAASVVSAMGADVDETNISITGSLRHSQKQRIAISTDIKLKFRAPDVCFIHWDGKIIQLAKSISSDRCCVYISGINFDGEEIITTKLLGVPEVPNSTGSAQEKAVMKLIAEWDLEKSVVGLVFDTTSSNTGRWRGASTLIEECLNRATLWIACRHHIYELHLKHVCEQVVGTTKEPGIKLFRRLKKEWNGLTIDTYNLNTFKYNSEEQGVQEQAQTVLNWALSTLKDSVFERGDYKELLELIVIWLGGHVHNFSFKFPGADHHARWMSKAIYFLKLALLQGQFAMDNEEITHVKTMAEFVGLYYGHAFLKSALPASAALNDINFMNSMLIFGQKEPEVAKVCIESCKRHLWYLTPQLLPFLFCDQSADITMKEELAKKLIATPRTQNISGGKPNFPVMCLCELKCASTCMLLPEMDLKNIGTRYEISTDFIDEKSWLLFDLINISDFEWLSKPYSEWESHNGYTKLCCFVKNCKVVNDIAERGIKLISDFAHKTHNEDQRQCLLQVVESHRNQFPDFKKSTLSNL